MKCPHCGNEEEFWVLEVTKSWVKINNFTETILDEGEVQENYYDQTKFECAKCERVIYEPWDAWVTK